MAAVLCCEEPLLGTNPPTGASVWACAVSLLAPRGRKGPRSQVVNQRLID